MRAMIHAKRIWRAVKFLWYYANQHTGWLALFAFYMVLGRLWLGAWSLPLVPLVVAVAAYAGVWTRNRAALRTTENREAEAVEALLAAWWLEFVRRSETRQRWVQGCADYGLKRGAADKRRHLAKLVPALRSIKFTLDGDIREATALPRAVGVPVDKLIANKENLAESVGCQEIEITRVHGRNGVVKVAMFWTDPVGRVLPVADLPMPPKGEIAFGIRRNGEPATVSIEAGPVLLVGTTGSGKSVTVESMLADLNRRHVWTQVFISDPKGGMELRALSKYVGEWKNRLQVAWFAENPTMTVTMVNRVVELMRSRQATIQGRKLTTFTQDMPLILVIMDDLLTTLPALSVSKRGEQSPLMMLLTEGRAAGILPIASAQINHATTIGDIRNAFTQRLGLRLMSAEATATVFGANAVSRGVMCHRLHKIKHRGVGWSDNDSGDLTRFRAALVKDADLARILEGLPPHGMTTRKPGGRKCAVYIAPSKDRVVNGEVVPFSRIEYVGKAFNPKSRFAQHRQDRPENLKFCPEHGEVENWWNVHVDESKITVEWFPNETAALAHEKKLTDKFMTTWNEKNNRDNPFAAWRRFPTKFSRWMMEGRQGPASTPTATALIDDERILAELEDEFRAEPSTAALTVGRQYGSHGAE